VLFADDAPPDGESTTCCWTGLSAVARPIDIAFF
jgi:hypothetical protein